MSSRTRTHEEFLQRPAEKGGVVEIGVVVIDGAAFAAARGADVWAVDLSGESAVENDGTCFDGWGRSNDTHVRVDQRQDHVDAPAHDVVAPGLVKGPERLGREDGNALRYAAVLGVGADAALLGVGADGLDVGGLHRESANVRAKADDGPVREVGNPGVIFQNLAVVVEIPVRDLMGS